MNKTILLLAGIASLFAMSVNGPAAAEEITQKAVLITGATSGIGRNAAERLAANGYFVYAGARKDVDMAELNEIENIMAVRLDVTKQQQIDAAVDLIASEGRGLWGLVNNAGVLGGGPTIETEESELDFIFDVNVFGVHRVTRAFAPMIIESKGRIVNISSISGVLANTSSAYPMSKHAIEAMTDSLDLEFKEAGIEARVIAIEPGNYSSSIGASDCRRNDNYRNIPEDTRFPAFWKANQEYCEKVATGGFEGESVPPDAVAAAIEDALFSENPKDHYLVVPVQRQAGWTIAKAMEELVNLNREHEFSYSREELIELLDFLMGMERGQHMWVDESAFEFLDAWMEKKKSGSNRD